VRGKKREIRLGAFLGCGRCIVPDEVVGWVQVVMGAKKAMAGRRCEVRRHKKGAVVWTLLPDWAFLEQPCHACTSQTGDNQGGWCGVHNNVEEVRGDHGGI
jgi:hypothetical protein